MNQSEGLPRDLETLARRMAEISRAPKDAYEVAAVLESMGWTDREAAQVFSSRDIFDLAGEVHRFNRDRVVSIPGAHRQGRGWLREGWLMVTHFLRGLMFVMPILFSIGAMLVLRYSLWSYQYLALDNATAIALGTMQSFLVTGGFTQAIARHGWAYISMREYGLARRVSFYLVRIGFGVVCLLGLVVILVNFVLALFPWTMIWYWLAYYLFLSFIWLSITVLYMLRQELLFTGIVVLGIVVLYIIHELVGLAIVPAQIIALSITALLSAGVSAHMLRRLELQEEGGLEVIPAPRASVLLYSAYPFFLYGLLYFLHLYADRFLAWSADSLFMPYVVWFRGQYELGLDWALFALLLPMGAVEVIINKFSRTLTDSVREVTADRAREFVRNNIATYWGQLLGIVVMAVTNGLLVYGGVQYLDGRSNLLGDFMVDPVTSFVFVWAIVGYVLTAVGLLNNLFLFSLNHPGPVVRAMVAAAGANVLVGFLASRLVDYHWAILGFFLGSVVLAVLSTKYVLQTLKELDFHVYLSV